MNRLSPSLLEILATQPFILPVEPHDVVSGERCGGQGQLVVKK